LIQQELNFETATVAQTLQPTTDPLLGQGAVSAAAKNAVLIYLQGSKEPKLFPLPPPGQTVLLSGLCKQTDLLSVFGSSEISLWRQTPEAPSGAKLQVRFTRKGDIDPLTDYALRPGDRIFVQEGKADWLTRLVRGI
jgi:hypothetical protein